MTLTVNSFSSDGVPIKLRFRTTFKQLGRDYSKNVGSKQESIGPSDLTA